MNERIKELIEESNEIVFSSPSTGRTTKQINLEKLAELIVKECASICYNSSLEDSDAHAQNLLYEFNIDNARNQK